MHGCKNLTPWVTTLCTSARCALQVCVLLYYLASSKRRGQPCFIIIIAAAQHFEYLWGEWRMSHHCVVDFRLWGSGWLDFFHNSMLSEGSGWCPYIIRTLENKACEQCFIYVMMNIYLHNHNNWNSLNHSCCVLESSHFAWHILQLKYMHCGLEVVWFQSILWIVQFPQRSSKY